MACDVCLGINSHKCPVCGDDPEREEEDYIFIWNPFNNICRIVSYEEWLKAHDDEEDATEESPWVQVPLDESKEIDPKDAENYSEI